MKEYYLVPRKSIDEGPAKVVVVKKAEVAPSLAPTPAASTPVAPVSVRANPSIVHLVHLKLKAKDHDYATSLLNYFDESKMVQWDVNGNLQMPVTGINIIDDILTKMTIHRSVFPREKLPLVKLFISLTSTPREMFRNTESRKQVFNDDVVLRRKRAYAPTTAAGETKRPKVGGGATWLAY